MRDRSIDGLAEWEDLRPCMGARRTSFELVKAVLLVFLRGTAISSFENSVMASGGSWVRVCPVFSCRAWTSTCSVWEEQMKGHRSNRLAVDGHGGASDGCDAPAA